jgi:DNA gyrase inhibitor GyrI
MMAVVVPERRLYRLATPMRDEDDPDSLGLSMGVLPGGPYLQLSLRGDARRVHRDIGPAFEELRGLGEHDPGRPCVEVYLSPHEVDCLLPVTG